jgi:Arc/MetJ-type ribon-helix-helix transcriptional regulator
MQNTKKNLVQVSFRIPQTLKQIIEQYVKCDLHVNASDFFREALREKIQRDAPQLYQALLKHD